MPLDSSPQPRTAAVATDASPSLDRDIRLAFLRLDASAAERLRRLAPVVDAGLPSIADAFYAFIGQYPPIAPLLGGPDQIARLKQTQSAPHHPDVSKLQRPGEPGWNRANSRNRVICDDRAGILAARNDKPILIQAYLRDLGDAKKMMLKEFDTPILVRGRQWGTLRLAIRP